MPKSPKKTGSQQPWEVLGVSRSKYFRDKREDKVTPRKKPPAPSAKKRDWGKLTGISALGEALLNPSTADGLTAEEVDYYSTAKAFEEGYTLLVDQPNETTEPRFHGFSFSTGDDKLIVSDVDGKLWVIDGGTGTWAAAKPHQPTTKPILEKDDGPHGIGWAVKQMHNGYTVRRSCGWSDGLKIVDGMIVSTGGSFYMAPSRDLLALDWEIAP